MISIYFGFSEVKRTINIYLCLPKKECEQVHGIAVFAWTFVLVLLDSFTVAFLWRARAHGKYLKIAR